MYDPGISIIKNGKTENYTTYVSWRMITKSGNHIWYYYDNHLR